MKGITNRVNQMNVPTIEPVADGISRPIWSVMIPTYNCADYLVETLESVLAQDPGYDNMQIEVVDDCSTKDDPETVVKEIGKGRVSFYRRPQNGGVTANFNTCLQRSRGHWVHILHGDDTVLPGFYKRLQEGIELEPLVGVALTRYIRIDENSHWKDVSFLERETAGILDKFLPLLAITNRIMTPCIAIKRSVYETIGGFHLELNHAADWEMWKRAIAYFPTWFEPQPLACYREHSSSDTSRLLKSGGNVIDVHRAIDIAESYLPSNIAVELSNKSREYYAVCALNTAYQMFSRGDIDSALNQIKAGLNCSSSSEVMNTLATLFCKSEVLQKVFAKFLVSKDNQEILNLAYSLDKIEQLSELNLKDLNLIVFPDWNQKETLLYESLSNLVKHILSHPENDKISLLVDNSGIPEEEANWIITDVLFNLFQQEDLDIAQEPNISLINNLTSRQWESLLPTIYGRIALDIDNKSILQPELKDIQVLFVEDISNIQVSARKTEVAA